MKNILTPVLLGLAAAAAPAAIAPASAQTIKGIATADANRAALQSNAYRNAVTARQTTYKPQIDSARAEQTAVQARLKPLVDKLQADAQGGKVPQAQLQTQYAEIQRIQQETEQRFQTIIRPIQLSEAYVNEQIGEKMDQAIKAAMAAKGISLVFDEQATVSRAAGYDMTADVTAELNKLIPTAQIVPPAGWLPRQQREAQAQQAAAAAAAPAAAPAAPAARPAQPASR